MKKCTFIFVYCLFLVPIACGATWQITFDHSDSHINHSQALMGKKIGQIAFLYYYSKYFTLVHAADTNKKSQIKVDDQTTYFDFHNLKEQDYGKTSRNEEYSVLRYKKGGEPEALRPQELQNFTPFLHKPSFAQKCMAALLGNFWSTRQKGLTTFTVGEQLPVENYTFEVVDPVGVDNNFKYGAVSQLTLAANSVQRRVEDCKITKGIFWNLHRPYTYVPSLQTKFLKGDGTDMQAQKLKADVYTVEVRKHDMKWQSEKNKKTLNVMPTVAAVGLFCGAFVSACTYFGRR